jgi:endonuclease/exonuclease/phosphatase family metal-dependent hydrolase
MQIVTYNIQYSKGKDDQFNLARIVSEIEGADVIALQEVMWNGPGLPDADQLGCIAELFSGYHWVYGPAVDLDGGAPGVRTQFGNMVLSRWPILASRMLLLPGVETYDRTSIQRCALEAVIAAPSGPIRTYSVHLDHLNPRHRRREVAFLRDAVLADTPTVVSGPPLALFDPPIASVPDAPEAVVLGDFNIVSGSAEHDELVGVEDCYEGRVIVADRLIDTWMATGHPVDSGATWSDGDLNVKLDYIFVTPGLAERVVSSRIDDDAVGSDHDPVWMELAN